MKLNILQANIEFLKRSTIGVMVAEVIETNNNLESVITYLETLDVKVEIIGYVNRNAIENYLMLLGKLCIWFLSPA